MEFPTRVRPYDVIVALDEAANSSEIFQKMEGTLSHTVNLKLVRPKKQQVPISKTEPCFMCLFKAEQFLFSRRGPSWVVDWKMGSQTLRTSTSNKVKNMFNISQTLSGSSSKGSSKN